MPSDLLTFISLPIIKSVLVYTNIIFAAVILGLFITLLMHKVLVERRSRQLVRLKERYRQELSQRCRDPLSVVTIPSCHLHYEACCSIIVELQAGSDEKTNSLLRHYTRQLGIDRYYCRQVGSRSWKMRFKAIEQLGYLRYPGLRPFFIEAIENERDARIVAKALWALSQVAIAADLPLINQHLSNPLFMSGKFNEFIYTNIIRAFRERNDFAELLKLLEGLLSNRKLPMLLRRDIIQGCGETTLTQAAPLILATYRHAADLPEVRIACIRALERLAAPELIDIVAECLADPDWRLRAAAAKEAYRCPSVMIEPIRQALYDRNYHVRINAAESLGRLGDAGLAALAAEAASTDRFVRDVVGYVLKRQTHAA